jgi:hypothetical protein
MAFFHVGYGNRNRSATQVVRFQRPIKGGIHNTSNDNFITVGLSNLALKPGETTRDLINLIIDTIVIIKERNAEYQNKVAKPQNDFNEGVNMATLENTWQTALPT